MKTAFYFAKPADSSIAAADASFIEALEQVARSLPSVRVVERPALADLVVVDERYEYRSWHYADELENCAFVREYANRVCVLNHDSYARVYLPGLYVSVEKSRPPLVSSRAIPYKKDLWQVAVPDSFEFQPNSLFTFRGTFHTHPIRDKICRIMAHCAEGNCDELRKAFHSHNDDDQKRYIKEIRGARFSLCPRGLSPSSYRLYESMQLGRSPVVISNDWLAPEGPAWEQFAIFVPEAEIARLPEILAQEADQAEARGREALAAWNEHFSWPQLLHYFLAQVLAFQMQRVQPSEYAALREIWRSRAFRRHYQWTIAGRAKQFLTRHYRALREKPVPETSA